MEKKIKIVLPYYNTEAVIRSTEIVENLIDKNFKVHVDHNDNTIIINNADDLIWELVSRSKFESYFYNGLYRSNPEKELFENANIILEGCLTYINFTIKEIKNITAKELFEIVHPYYTKNQNTEFIKVLNMCLENKSRDYILKYIESLDIDAVTLKDLLALVCTKIYIIEDNTPVSFTDLYSDLTKIRDRLNKIQWHFKTDKYIVYGEGPGMSIDSEKGKIPADEYAESLFYKFEPKIIEGKKLKISEIPSKWLKTKKDRNTLFFAKNIIDIQNESESSILKMLEKEVAFGTLCGARYKYQLSSDALLNVITDLKYKFFSTNKGPFGSDRIDIINRRSVIMYQKNLSLDILYNLMENFTDIKSRESFMKSLKRNKKLVIENLKNIVNDEERSSAMLLLELSV